MQALWKLQKAFVREIIVELPEPKPAYNTVSTIVRILESKQFVAHNAFGKSHQYFPLVAKEDYSKFSLEMLLNNYFGGSIERLVSFFVRENNLSLAEFEELLELVKEDVNKPEAD